MQKALRVMNVLKLIIFGLLDLWYRLTSRGYKQMETFAKLLGELDKHSEGKS